MLQFKILSQDYQLQYDQKNAEKDGKVSERKREVKA